VLKKLNFVMFIALIVVLYSGVVFAVGNAFAQKTTPDAKKQNTVVLGEDEVKQMLALMDTDKNGKISKAEFMKFMEAEFDRLDKDKSGELDAKELTQSLVRPSRGAVGK
jgi:hypothetical protein